MDINDTLKNLRTSYKLAALDVQDCSPDPKVQFNLWLLEAIKSQCEEPSAFVLSTVREGRPRARVVLLKGIHDGQFVFYSNYKSAKGHEIELNDHVCMTFFWPPLQRQVRVEGLVTKIPAEISDDYFKGRPRGSQLGALASPQSQKISGREELEKLFERALQTYPHGDIPRPSHWGGYGITPTYFEFWQGRDNRMHDRISYEKRNEGWALFRLAP